MIRIGLTDDQLLFRQVLASLIRNIKEYDLVMEADNGIDCLEKLSLIPDPPDIILMDMEMPGMDGIELNKILHAKYPSIKVIVLSVHANERLIANMIEAGASGYLVKNCDKEELLAAIQSVISSGYYINTNVLKAIQLASDKKNKKLKNVSHIDIEISEREKEILGLICKELSNAEIAEKLFISIRTVEGHRNNLLIKTGCKNTAGLVVFAIKSRLVDLVF
jgi:DNA-binding NarL/FixJ family response regulator